MYFFYLFPNMLFPTCLNTQKLYWLRKTTTTTTTAIFQNTSIFAMLKGIFLQLSFVLFCFQNNCFVLIQKIYNMRVTTRVSSHYLSVFIAAYMAIISSYYQLIMTKYLLYVQGNVI